ncbi:MAG: FAD-binding oxidoreductase [bacterium]|nr:FAD-binding oxidoreductase [bacterium]
MTQVVVCGAGIAGISTAFHLTRMGVTDIVIADPLPPLTLTSDKSTECYRNWWPNEPMVRLMNRSVELLDRYAIESNDIFDLNRRGYLYLTSDTAALDQIAATAAAATTAGAGELRVHGTGHSKYRPEPDHPIDGADLFIDGDELRTHFPFVTEAAVGGLHARVAGWLSAQQLGAWMLDQAVEAGAALVRSRVESVSTKLGQIDGVSLEDGTHIATPTFVNAAGPMLREIGLMTGVDLPVFSEIHAKVNLRDHAHVVPGHAPMMIWSDQQEIDWSEDAIAYLRDEGRSDLIGLMPSGCHARPEGGSDSPWVLGLWEYHTEPVEPTWPIAFDVLYPEVVLRGLTTMIPALSGYRDRIPETIVDGGYYTKTIENRPLAGPAGPRGSFVCGALSGFGIMAACAVGELTAMAATGGELPKWARWFDVSRYNNPGYLDTVSGDTGQI